MSRDGLILVVGRGSGSYYKPFRPFGSYVSVEGPQVGDAIRDAKGRIRLVVFTGGEDVHPQYYGEQMGMHTQANYFRDEQELQAFRAAKELGVPMAGICRGSQFLCVANGGKLAQDITHHAMGDTHPARTHDDRLIEVTSTHHQMAIPPADARILCVAEPYRSRHYLNGNDRPIEPSPREVEAAYYPATKSLGMQWHPEYRDEGDECFDYCQQLVREFLLPG